jgi:putative oxidoreductase
MLASPGQFPQPGCRSLAVVVEIGLGLLLLLGYRTRAVALGLALWCIVTAVFFHRNFADQNMMIQFLKNLMIAGGLLQIVHFGAGAVSLDNRGRARSGSGVEGHHSAGAST